MTSEIYIPGQKEPIATIAEGKSLPTDKWNEIRLKLFTLDMIQPQHMQLLDWFSVTEINPRKTFILATKELHIRPKTETDHFSADRNSLKFLHWHVLENGQITFYNPDTDKDLLIVRRT